MAAELERENPAFGAEVSRLRPLVARLQGMPREAWEDVEPPPPVLPDAAPEPEAGPVTAETSSAIGTARLLPRQARLEVVGQGSASEHARNLLSAGADELARRSRVAGVIPGGP